MPDRFNEAYGYSWEGIPVGGAALSLLIVLLSIVLKMFLAYTMKKMSRRSTGFLGALALDVSRPVSFLVVTSGIYMALKVHDLPGSLENTFVKVFLFLFTTEVIWLLLKSIDTVAGSMAKVAQGTESRMDDQLIPILSKLTKFLLVMVGIVFYMQSNGYPVSSILAGMGIGGLAMALAAQDSIAGIFASVVIFLDKPFMINDFVEINGVVGTVEEIGIRSTRIRTLEQTLVTIPNKEIMDSKINNFSLRSMRRTETRIGVTYDTTPGKMRLLLQRLRQMLEEDDMVDDEAVYVYFAGFGDSSLDVDMKYFVKTADYRTWLERREAINLKIMDVVHDLGLDFAFPTTTVYLEQ